MVVSRAHFEILTSVPHQIELEIPIRPQLKQLNEWPKIRHSNISFEDDSRVTLFEFEILSKTN